MYVLDHHDRRIHQDADGDGQPPERHEVGGDTEELHHDEGKQHRQRQDQRHGERRAQVAEQHDQHQHHQHHRLAKSHFHREHRGVNEITAIIVRFYDDTLRKGGCEAGELLFDGFDHRATVRADTQQHQTGHDVALAVGGHPAVAHQCSLAHAGHVADAHGHAAARHHRDAADVVSIAQLAQRAHQQHAVLAVDAVAAGVAIVSLDGVLEIVA